MSNFLWQHTPALSYSSSSSVCSRWSTGCTVPTTLCKRRPTAPSTVWSIPLTHHWWICGTRGRWRLIRRRLEATWVCLRWWSRAFVFPLEKRWWEQNTPHYWSSRRRRRRSRWGECGVRLHKITSSVFNIWSVKCWASTVRDHSGGFIPFTTSHYLFFKWSIHFKDVLLMDICWFHFMPV